MPINSTLVDGHLLAESRRIEGVILPSKLERSQATLPDALGNLSRVAFRPAFNEEKALPKDLLKIALFRLCRVVGWVWEREAKARLLRRPLSLTQATRSDCLVPLAEDATVRRLHPSCNQ